MTDENKRDTEKWIEDKGAKHPYGYDKGGKLKRFFGIRGIPHAVLIDPTGTIVWRGHPARLTNDIVESHLKGALETPVYEWPASARKVRQSLERRQFAKAIDEARDLGEEGAPIVAALERMVEASLAGLKAAAEAGDWLAVEERGKAAEKELAGLPAADEAKEILTRLENDEAAQEILAAQREVRKLMGGRIRKGDVPRIERRLEQVMASHSGTAAARDAKEALERLPK